MSFNQKSILISMFICLAAAASSVWYYQRVHPKYVPLPPREEVVLTIIPGWNLRQVADYLVLKGFASTTEDVYKISGSPAKVYRSDFEAKRLLSSVEGVWNLKPYNLSYEGYLAPETYRVFADSSLESIFEKFLKERNGELSVDVVDVIGTAQNHSFHEILTMASIIEKEVKYPEDRAIVADILWRRLAKGWALQVDSSVHYAVDRTGDVFTTDKERDVNSPWNTYKYKGLPPGPISNPGLDSIKAAIYPEKNSYWYFLSDKDGHMHYGHTLDEQNANKAKYLRK
ncbi:MAG TPA: endolytic transglycosylase MltG [Candidatus Udaeobacter sp.]|nr:endolytic transglycosylase MltG [Candidatus Udaeobacter sp.]